MRCVLCAFDPGLRPPPDGVPRPAVYVLDGLSTCEEHMGEAACGNLNRAIASMREQIRIRETTDRPRTQREHDAECREGTW